MRLLIQAAIRNSKRLTLLFVTCLFMVGVTVASQLEMLSLGVITTAGHDFFSLFSKGGEQDQAITQEQVREQWPLIDRDNKGAITLQDAKRHMASKPDRNPLKKILHRIATKVDFEGNFHMLAVLLVVVAILKGVSMFGSQYTKQLVMVHIGRDLRQQYFEHIHKLSLDFYHQYNVGSLASRIGGDAGAVAQGVYSALTSYLQTPVAVILSLSVCLYVSVQLSVLVFVAFPLVLVPVLWIARGVKRVARACLRNHEQLQSALIESVSGIHTVKLFASEKTSVEKFRQYNTEMARLEAKSARYAFLARPFLHVAATFMLAVIIIYGIYWAHLSVPMIFVFCGLVYLMYEPIKRLNDENLQIQRGIVAAERMFEVLKLEPQIQDAKDAVAFEGLKQQIEFRDVGFRYQEDWVLRGVNLTIKRGAMVAIVGPTGAGKSTLVQLLARLYEPQEGGVFIDGKSIADYQQASLRKQIAFVPQKPYFFLDTVTENIAFGGKFNAAEVERAARLAHAHEFITALSKGYETVLSERAKDLSGGQQQRLAIARALVRGPDVLVLDEATSSLDAISENKIKQALEELRGRMTQIIIAHRLSTIEDADLILYVDQGRITAQGNKDELLITCPGFRAMWDLMKRGQVVDKGDLPAALPELVGAP